jgi:hypothetical protein
LAFIVSRSVFAGIAIFTAWFLIDVLAHRLILEPLYASSANLWRPSAEMSTSLVITATFVLVAVFVAVYKALVRPKSIGAALCLGGLLGIALGTSSGVGTYIHSPIPLPLAWGWFVLGSVKGIVAGVVLGVLVTEKRMA